MAAAAVRSKSLLKEACGSSMVIGYSDVSDESTRMDVETVNAVTVFKCESCEVVGMFT